MTLPSPSRSLGLLLASGLLACSSASVGSEWGIACSDGKDNDGDGAIDCFDPDCRSTPMCGGRSDAGRDGSPGDRGATDGAPDRPPSTDQPPASSYGTPCPKPLAACPDGKTTCIPGMNTSASAGFCTYPCLGTGSTCPAPAAGQLAACVYGFNGRPYCAFLCKYSGQDYVCPAGLDCTPATTYQGYCWPR